MAVTVILYRQYSPALSSTEPTISVSQCTPATSLPITMNVENRMTKATVIRQIVWLFQMLFVSFCECDLLHSNLPQLHQCSIEPAYCQPQPTHTPVWTQMTTPQAEQVHCFRSRSRKAAIPASRMNRRFSSGDSRSGYCDPYRVSFSMTSAQGKSGHSSQNEYPLDFLY